MLFFGLHVVLYPLRLLFPEESLLRAVLRFPALYFFYSSLGLSVFLLLTPEMSEAERGKAAGPKSGSRLELLAQQRYA